LVHGDPAQVGVVRWIFGQYVERYRSLRWLCGDLNRRKVPGPDGGIWQHDSIKVILRNPVYRGDFAFGRNPTGQFHRTSEVIVIKGRYQPMVEPALFDKAARRLKERAKDRSQCHAKYSFASCLYCDHCGKRLTGFKQHERKAYKCSSSCRKGSNKQDTGACPQWYEYEDRIGPFLLTKLGEEIEDLSTLKARPPQSPKSEQSEGQQRLGRERKELLHKIDKAEDRVMFIEDARTRQSLDKKISMMRDELERIEADLSTAAAEPSGLCSAEDLEAFKRSWREWFQDCVKMPVPVAKRLASLPEGSLTRALVKEIPSLLEEPMNVDSKLVNAGLRQLGCKVFFRWERITSANRKYQLMRVRWQLGQQSGDLPGYMMEGSARRTPTRAGPLRSSFGRLAVAVLGGRQGRR
jgi:hypothetical protein